MSLGQHVVKSYSRQQKTVALSSAEAELHAMVAASAETLGLITLCKDLGMVVEGDIYVDSSAALGISLRTGIGKMRHVNVQALWVQEVRCNRRLRYHKVLGTRNPSDILTKHVNRELLATHTRTLGLEHREGRASTAPSLDTVEAYTEERELSLASQTREIRHVRFSTIIAYRSIPAMGNMRSVRRARKSRWPSPSLERAEDERAADERAAESRSQKPQSTGARRRAP